MNVLAWVASYLTFLGMAALAFNQPVGWLLRLMADLQWFYWSIETKPKGWKAVMYSEMIFAILDTFGMWKNLCT